MQIMEDSSSNICATISLVTASISAPTERIVCIADSHVIALSDLLVIDHGITDCIGNLTGLYTIEIPQNSCAARIVFADVLSGI